jgi:hypothetical protein
VYCAEPLSCCSLFTVTPVYIVAGCIYKNKKMGTALGTESCPQNEFWCAIPSLAKVSRAVSFLRWLPRLSA